MSARQSPHEASEANLLGLAASAIEPFPVKGQLGIFDVHVTPGQLLPLRLLFRQ